VKFLYVSIPVSVSEDQINKTPHTLSVPMFVSDECTPTEAVERLGELLRDKLNTVDLGDET